MGKAKSKESESGKLRIGDDWNAIRIIALSQSNPLKAVAEPRAVLYGPCALAVGVTSLTVTVSVEVLVRPSESVTVRVAV